MLENNLNQPEDIMEIRSRVLRKFPLLGVTMSSLKNVADDGVKTAGTDGHIVYYSPKFFSSLTEEQRTAVYAHEVMHVAFNHILRSRGRNQQLWNIATDSVINQLLKNADLPLIQGCVNMPEAVNCSAEEMYEKLLKEQEQKKQEQQNKNNSQDNQQQESEENQKSQHSSDSQSSQQEDRPQDQEEESLDADQDKNQPGNPQGDGDGNNSEDEDEQVGYGNHQIWKKAIEEAEKEQQRQEQERQQQEMSRQQPQSQQPENDDKKKSLLDRIKDFLSKKDEPKEKPQLQPSPSPSQPLPQSSSDGENVQRQKRDDSSFEKSFSAENRKAREHLIEEVRRNLERQKNETMKTMSEAGGYTYGDLGKAQAVVDWKKMLRKSVEEEEDRWSYRRSGADNDYMARVEELEDENKSETEVMLDVSGSVDEQMLKEFLRQLKPILKNSKLKVGCFDHRIFGFKEIKNDKDIDNFVIRGGGGTDIDMAVRAFSKSKEVNKIIFTDGYSNSMPKNDLKRTNVIWLIYDNNNFHPVCGKVIYVDKSQINQNYIKTPQILPSIQQQTCFQQAKRMQAGR